VKLFFESTSTSKNGVNEATCKGQGIKYIWDAISRGLVLSTPMIEIQCAKGNLGTSLHYIQHSATSGGSGEAIGTSGTTNGVDQGG
jgi:hypothetical protein